MGDYPNKPKTVEEAKQQFREVTETKKPDYLAKVKERPLESAGVAFLAGMMLQDVTKRGVPVSLLNIGVQLMKNKL